MTTLNFEKYVNHLDQFYDTLPPTSIKFIWKASGTTNWVSTSACQFPLSLPSNTEFYLRKGFNKSFCYIYKKSHLTFLLKAYQRSKDPVLLYNVVIEHRQKSSDPIDQIVNHGEHLTFGLVRLMKRHGSPPQIKADTHLTMYNHESLNPSQFHRDETRCNFTFEENPSCQRFIGFQKQTCFNAPLYSIGTTYNIDHQHVIHKLYKMAIRGPPKPRDISGGKPFFGQYKNIHYKSQEFTDFISEQLLLDEKQRSVEMIYDEDPKSMHIVCILDHDHDNRSLIYMDKKRIMKAVYAHTQVMKGQGHDLSNGREKSCLEKMKACFIKINEQLAK